MKLRTAIAICLIVLSISAPQLLAQENCHLDDSVWMRFENYLSWMDSWWQEDYFPPDGTLALEYASATNIDATYWDFRYPNLPRSTLLIIYSPYFITREGCFEPDWTKCAKPVRKIDAEELRKREIETIPVELSGICHEQLRRASVPPWTPSPDSPAKQTIIEQIRAALRDYGFQRLVTGTVNDFNVLDNMVYVVGNLEDDRGKQSQILISMEIHEKASHLAVNRTEDESAGNKHIIDRVLNHGISVYPCEGKL